MAYGDWLLLDREDSIATITLNHPETFNLVNWQLLEELAEIQDVLEKDETVRAVIINASGEHFSAGIDLKTLEKVNSQFVMKNLTWLQRVYSRWQEWPIPVIAAIHGLCYGSAMELILGCDIRIAAEDSRMAIPEVRFALAPDMGGTTRLTKLVGVGQAKRLIMGCEEIDAREAYNIGLVEIVVKRQELMNRARKLARKMCNLPPAAMAFAKKGINLAAESSVASSLLFEQAQSTFCCGTQDQNEAIAAFFAKRPPEFKGY
jgi:enoyl-CoA hydratase